MPRADVFIDASNFNIACRDLTGGRRVDIKAQLIPEDLQIVLDEKTLRPIYTRSFVRYGYK